MNDIPTIAANLRTQDNAITNSPIFLIQQKVRRFTDGDDTDAYLWVDGDWNEVEDPSLIAYLNKIQDAISPDRRYADYSKQHYYDEWTFCQPFFTRAGAEAYIKVNGHNLCEPRIYVESGSRNEEWATVRAHLMAWGHSEKVAGRKHPTDLRTYVEGYLHSVHADHREFPGNTEIRYINEPYRWKGQIHYLVQYVLITKIEEGSPYGSSFHAKCSCEVSFDDPNPPTP